LNPQLPRLQNDCRGEGLESGLAHRHQIRACAQSGELEMTIGVAQGRRRCSFLRSCAQIHDYALKGRRISLHIDTGDSATDFACCRLGVGSLSDGGLRK
jgi:hypothetical protein